MQDEDVGKDSIKALKYCGMFSNLVTITALLGCSPLDNRVAFMPRIWDLWMRIPDTVILESLSTWHCHWFSARVATALAVICESIETTSALSEETPTEDDTRDAVSSRILALLGTLVTVLGDAVAREVVERRERAASEHDGSRTTDYEVMIEALGRILMHSGYRLSPMEYETAFGRYVKSIAEGIAEELFGGARTHGARVAKQLVEFMNRYDKFQFLIS
jgi:hypothetical protein